MGHITDTMMLTAGGRFVKYALFLANLAILLGGIVMFSVGAWAFIDSSFMERLIGNDQFITSAATLMASGCVVVAVSLLGCLGAFKEIRCLLIVVSSYWNYDWTHCIFHNYTTFESPCDRATIYPC